MCRLTKRFTVLILWLAFLFASLSTAYPNHSVTVSAPVPVQRHGMIGWETVPAILARIKPPTFPAREFKITDFGARPGDDSDNTEAIRKAIAACYLAGGGRVVVPPGVFQTGAIHLKSNVNLHVSEGATLKFSPDPAKYLPVVYTRFEGTECLNYSPLIYAFEQENIAVTDRKSVV